ncbi:hypothetical protein [Streptomyces sp. SID3343]|nr:hypothetical protein [Streptomyces sp. SID3343]
MPEVMQAVHAGRNIQAIKFYRQRTGVRLEETKQAIDDAGRGR